MGALIADGNMLALEFADRLGEIDQEHDTDYGRQKHHGNCHDQCPYLAIMEKREREREIVVSLRKPFSVAKIIAKNITIEKSIRAIVVILSV
ncbi:hypothetical protein [Rhizobium sp. CC-YZS058]|uniref:hypothetical protein n=1 Tax=Rhizobium sp. CC-YZS058 TaxID=3042153 RepID=UPI002B052EEC|nr:hypothetical protein [Rhizobium sp. CC-YZS058]MEA3534829.1 hypothetical protein [Rhizobium sp. CC-YZS058]